MSDAAFIVLVLAAVVLVLVTLATGEVCGLASHGHHLPDPGGATRASLGQWLHLSDPARAWPSPDQAALGPAPLYWCVLLLVCAALVVVGIAIRRLVGRSDLGGSRRLGVDRRARLAAAADVRRLVVGTMVSGRIVLGHWRSPRGPLLATEDEVPAQSRRTRRRSVTSGRPSVIVLGPSRSGKTMGIAVPAVTEWDGPAVVVSVKGDILDATVAARRSRGEIQVFDPRRVTGFPSGTWSPISRATTLADAIRVARGLGEASPYGAKSDGEFWRATAEDLLGPLLFCAHLGGRSMSQVLSWVLAGSDEDGDEDWRDEITWIFASRWTSPTERRDAELAMAQLAASWTLSGVMHSSVWLMARVTLRPWADPEIAASAIDPSIHVDWLLSGDHTLYVCAPARQQAEMSPVFAGIVSGVLDAAAEAAQGQGGQLARRLLVVLDEAANTAPLRDLATYASTAGGQGIQLLTVYQDLAQIRTRYQEASASIVNNHLAKVILPGVSDPETLRLVSELCGEEEYSRRSQSRNLADRGGSVSSAPADRRLLPMDLLRRMPVGNGLLLYGQLPPVHMVLRLGAPGPSTPGPDPRESEPAALPAAEGQR